MEEAPKIDGIIIKTASHHLLRVMHDRLFAPALRAKLHLESINFLSSLLQNAAHKTETSGLGRQPAVTVFRISDSWQ